MVGDAKAFRLSRTAKNAKDFKVEALNQWRKGADYALLLSPLYQYPNTRSQIYAQAIRYNVTILSYAHLAFIIRSRWVTSPELEKMLTLSKKLHTGQNAQDYWYAMTTMMLQITGKKEREWETAVQIEQENLAIQAKKQITYWAVEKQRIKSLDRDELAKQLIHHLKVDSKIDTIGKIAGLDLKSYKDFLSFSEKEGNST